MSEVINKNEFKKTYHELKVGADGEQLPEAITVDIESLNKFGRTKLILIKVTPYEHAKTKLDAKNKGCNVTDLFRPIIEKIAKKK